MMANMNSIVLAASVWQFVVASMMTIKFCSHRPDAIQLMRL